MAALSPGPRRNQPWYCCSDTSSWRRPLIGQRSVGYRHSAFSLCALLECLKSQGINYNDAIISAMASQITSLTVVYSTVYPGVDQRKHQSSTSLAFVRGIHRSPANSLHAGPVTRKVFPFVDVIMVGDEWCDVFWVMYIFRTNRDYVIGTWECTVLWFKKRTNWNREILYLYR